LSETLAIKNDNVVAFAAMVGVELQGSLAERADMAALHTAASTKHDVAAGLLWMSIKAEAPHGGLAKLMEERGADPRAVQRSVNVAEFVLRQPPSIQAKLLATPKTKVLELAKADPEVLKIALEDGGGIDIDALSVRQLSAKLKETEARLTNAEIDRERAENDLAVAQRRLSGERADRVPLMVAEIRAELMAQEAKITLAMQSIESLVGEMAGMVDSKLCDEWADATLRLAQAALHKTALLTHAALTSVSSYLPEGESAQPVPMSALSPQELKDTARKFAELTQTHQYEADLRKWERQQARPKGRGRPVAKPVAPNPAA
jgi:DNA-binding transcriptional regulator YiaG